MASHTEEQETQAAGPASPHLDERERDQADAHSTPRALVVHEIIRRKGETAPERPALALLWSALAAGLSMGFSFLTEAVLETRMSPSGTGGHVSLVSAAGYCVGFVIVVPGRQQFRPSCAVATSSPCNTRTASEPLFTLHRRQPAGPRTCRFPSLSLDAATRVLQPADAHVAARCGFAITASTRQTAKRGCEVAAGDAASARCLRSRPARSCLIGRHGFERSSGRPAQIST
jgi:hypothetical protein